MPDTSPKHGLRLVRAILQVEGLMLMAFGGISLGNPAFLQGFIDLDKVTAMTFAGVITFAGLCSFLAGRLIMRGKERV